MTLFLRAMLLGHVAAASAAIWLSASGAALWAAILVAWIGGNLLGLALMAVGASLWPAAPARRSSFTVTDSELRLWDEDLARELIDADVRRDVAPAPGQGAGRETGQVGGQGARLRDAS